MLVKGAPGSSNYWNKLNVHAVNWTNGEYIDDLLQDCSVSSGLALQSCTKTWICHIVYLCCFRYWLNFLKIWKYCFNYNEHGSRKTFKNWWQWFVQVHRQVVIAARGFLSWQWHVWQFCNTEGLWIFRIQFYYIRWGMRIVCRLNIFKNYMFKYRCNLYSNFIPVRSWPSHYLNQWWFIINRTLISGSTYTNS